MSLMKLHEELDKSLRSLMQNAEHRKLRINENKLLDIIARVDMLSSEMYLLKGINS